MDTKNIARLIFEWHHLSRIRHEGYALLGVDNPESVAAHNLHAAQIGYVLAKMEGYENPQEVVSILVFHEIGETRIGDVHRIGDRYIEKDEERAVKDQLSGFGFGDDILSLWEQLENRSTTAGDIAKDADILQTCFVVKELSERGYFIGEWVENARKYVKTDSARKLIDELSKVRSTDWFNGLKTFKNLKKFED